MHNHSITNRILIQAETEEKAYIEELLKAVGRTDVRVSFADEENKETLAAYRNAQLSSHKQAYLMAIQTASIERIAFGFLPVN